MQDQCIAVQLPPDHPRDGDSKETRFSPRMLGHKSAYPRNSGKYRIIKMLLKNLLEQGRLGQPLTTGKIQTHSLVNASAGRTQIAKRSSKLISNCRVSEIFMYKV